ISFSLYRLCLHPQYQQPLHNEISADSAKDLFASTNNSTPLLDSFLKETAKVHPLENGQLL
ncbi:hypothetical protein BJ875DRAFT_375562, partial [Amylocarpus encephaloides]